VVTGPTGHGKSSSLAALIEKINREKSVHIITIEDPIEYLFTPKRALIAQREMHNDTHSWQIALRSALREDIDVVLIGEMRDQDTVAAALTIAETGHLVFATLHTNSAAQTVDRIIDAFPENQQNQVRQQLAAVLQGVVSQRLLKGIEGGRFPAVEILIANPAVRTLIREEKTHMIDNVISTSSDLGMQSLETSLAELVREGKVSLETAMQNSLRPNELMRLVKK
jgi:twitching motility protein PilT